MKHRYISIFAAVSALLMLQCCDKVELPSDRDDSDELVTFNPTLAGESDETRGSMITGTTYDYSDLGPFWVLAYDGSSRLFDYTKVMQFVHADGSKHTYWSTVDGSGNLKEYYWKKSSSSVNKMYFYAYTNIPAGSVLSFYTAGSYQKIWYYVSKCLSAAEQKDILLASYAGRGSLKDGWVGRFADLDFQHPLAAVKFKRGTIEGWTASDKITDVKIGGVYSKGRFRNSSGSVTLLTDSDAPSGSSTVYMSDASGLDIAADSLVGETFFLIPQDFSAQNITIEVTMTVGGSVETASASLSAGSWTSGNYYTYTLNFSGGNDIGLDVSLSDWGSLSEDVEVGSGSALYYDDPAVDTWSTQDQGDINYTE